MTGVDWLFVIVGVIAVASAVFMLTANNAVHSALFLIVTMGCIAFLFLMLNAPFLAMVQVIVYAGAIMVLFLFVIMLLGAEQLEGGTPFRWMTPVAMLLALVFLFIAALALGEGTVSEFAPVTGQPRLRVAVLTSEPVSLSIDGEELAAALETGDSLAYTRLSEGDHVLVISESGGGEDLLSQTLSLDDGFVGTAVIYAQGGATALSLVDDNILPTSERSGRITLFNAYDVPVTVVDTGNETDPDDTVVLIDNVPAGELSELQEFAEDTNLEAWAVVDESGEVLARLRNDEVFAVDRDTATLLVVAEDERFEGVTRALALPLVSAVAPSFGSPSDVGQVLFNTYMLPMQAVAVLLLVAMVGAIVLTHKPKELAALARARLGRRRVSRPLTSVIASQVGQDVTEPRSGQDQLPAPADEPAGD